MKNILLPTDFSENSQNAIIFALELFRGSSVQFHMLNVQRPSEYTTGDIILSSPGDTIFGVVMNDNKIRLKNLIAELKEQYKDEDYEFEVHVDFDTLTDAMNQIIQKNKMDLIIMGTNGATGAREVLFGSNTLNVIRKINCPLLAIPEGYVFSKLDSFLFTSDSCKDLGHENTKPMKQLMEMFNPVLHVLKIKPDTAVTHNCDTCLQTIVKTGSVKSYTVKGIPAPMVIDTFVQMNSVDVHAMFVKRESFMDRFIFGSDTTKISYKTRIPLLLMHK